VKYLIAKDKKGSDSLEKAVQKKFTKREFDDPVLQDLANTLGKDFRKMTKEMMAEIKQVMKLSDREFFVKARGDMRAGHKYIKRTGGPGNYRYWYKMPDGSMQVKDKDGHVLAGGDPNQEHSEHYKPNEHDTEIALHPQFEHTLTITRDHSRPKLKITKDSRPTIRAIVRTNTNMIGETNFTPDAVDSHSSLLKDADAIINAMGIQLKTPLNFDNQPEQKVGAIHAEYKASTKDGFSHGVTLYGQGTKLAKVLMQEIGHGIDFSLSSSNRLIPFSEETEETPEMRALLTFVGSLPFYQLNEGVPNIDTTPERFARAFEVYAYTQVKSLAARGQISKEFLRTMTPDLFTEKGGMGLKSMSYVEQRVSELLGPMLSNKIRKSFHKSGPNKTRIMIVQGGTRSKDSCPGKDTKLRHLVELIKKRAPDDVRIDVLDLAVEGDGEIIQYCKGCIGTSGGFHCQWRADGKALAQMMKSVKKVNGKFIYKSKNGKEFDLNKVRGCTCYGPGSNSEDLKDIMHDDYVYYRLEQADAVLFLTPIHWAKPSGPIVVMLDRLVCSSGTVSAEAMEMVTGNDIKNPEKTALVEMKGEMNHLKTNWLEGKTAAIFMRFNLFYGG